MARFINIVLLIAIAFGVMTYWNIQRKAKPIRDERDRLAARYGQMRVNDPTQAFLEQVEIVEGDSQHRDSEGRAHYLWRMYLPEDEELIFSYQMPNSSGTMLMQGREQQGLIRFRIGKYRGQWKSYLATSNSAMSGGFVYPDPISEFLWEHWDELEVTIAGESRIACDLSKPIDLLTVKVPPELQERLRREVPGADRSTLLTSPEEPLVTIRYGSREAMELP